MVHGQHGGVIRRAKDKSSMDQTKFIYLHSFRGIQPDQTKIFFDLQNCPAQGLIDVEMGISFHRFPFPLCRYSRKRVHTMTAGSQHRWIQCAT
jgi:hypothetical protein